MEKTSSQNTIGQNTEAIKRKKRPTVASSGSTTILTVKNKECPFKLFHDLY